ncbi:hypothetical protein FOB58_001500 [Candida parapsilosis]|uniref:Uncharacterized protein n=2 Tax=Candida parapsilosis TaxID=5480 RepID=G8BBM4_CANPC|nr:uncharacterized protein CPAR2_800910 [Candida parapsilosis]KAF6051440.1 hypothetical protein FOB58_001500 [Candida parapsilosis]KAF6053063.1 hypothetical protein FOB60_003319 [Candida parapsilosis]KAF6053242.1 hypothetical protein FOB59_001524 [Candida parapsilosis]KAF6064841.1 hypothetical protein FOB61_003267 [Candida parapsilosis]KAI5902170.1 hypothetical protein K4G60_g1310 [Candida parapsilosis]
MTTTSHPAILDEEIAYVQGLLESIPFSSDRTTHFLNVYKIYHQDLIKLNDQPLKFPIEASKLLKLNISLGNLLKALQTEEEIYKQQNLQQKRYLNKLNSIQERRTATPSGLKEEVLRSPAADQSVKHVINSGQVSQSLQPPYQVRFVKNMVTILKNFDIDVPVKQEPSYNRDSTTSSSFGSAPHTPKRMISNGSNSGAYATNSSPIKLNSKQLLIEKLEINIKLDNLFIYKITFKLILEIYRRLQQSLQGDGSVTSSPSKVKNDDESSIFSGVSASSQDSNMGNEEYLRYVNNLLRRISYGITQPFVALVFREYVEQQISDDFTQLINTL